MDARFLRRPLKVQEKPGASRGRNAAERAKQYMEHSGVQNFLQAAAGL